MSHYWVSYSVHSGVPINAVLAGNEPDGAPIYVGRAYHEGDLLPAKVIPSRNAAYVSHSGREISVHQFEILCGNGLTWVASSNGHVPDGAVSCGSQSNGESLFVGRAHLDGSLTPGKIHRSHGCLYIPFNGTEHSIQQYEVLVASRKCEWISTSAHASLPEGAILGGHDVDGDPIYIGRTYHGGDQLPAKVIPSKQVAYVSYGGQEHAKHQYEILCHGRTSWVPSGNGSIPHGAVVAGRTENGETLYVGRASYNGSLTPGKVHPSHNTLYIPFSGVEVSIRDYEILVEQ